MDRTFFQVHWQEPRKTSVTGADMDMDSCIWEWSAVVGGPEGPLRRAHAGPTLERRVSQRCEKKHVQCQGDVPPTRLPTGGWFAGRPLKNQKTRSTISELLGQRSPTLSILSDGDPPVSADIKWLKKIVNCIAPAFDRVPPWSAPIRRLPLQYFLWPAPILPSRNMSSKRPFP